ncbi:39143_t:CDS:2 [Gigaspora margarita]|uniref:39143_t:CDS:1 n=1 Tax=Gigaspora margarita TaxID=4874 RepID=A0ABN7W8B8_GIGMA|nr:39143_t:CDS:2 [Gigaspora margarita]
MEQEFIFVNYQNQKSNSKGKKILGKLKSWTKKAIFRRNDKPLMLNQSQQQLSRRNSISSSIYDTSERTTIPLSRPISQVSRLPRPLSQISQITSRSNNIVSPLPLPTVIEEKNSHLDDIQIACRLYEVLSCNDKRDVISEKSVTLTLENNNSLYEEKNHSIHSEEKNISIYTEEKRNSAFILGKECPSCKFWNDSIMLECELCHTLFYPNNYVYITRTNALSRTSLSTSDIYSYLPNVENTQMTVLNDQDQDYIIVKRMFFSDIPRAEIKGIIRLDMPTKLIKSHEKFKKKIAKKSGLKTENITHSMFHGTTSSFDCNPERFLQGNREFCKKGCGVCGIAKQGNKKKYSKHSKISNDYTNVNSHIQVMFIVDVVADKHDWIIVARKNKATLPRFMIIFDKSL